MFEILEETWTSSEAPDNVPLGLDKETSSHQRPYAARLDETWLMADVNAMMTKICGPQIPLNRCRSYPSISGRSDI